MRTAAATVAATVAATGAARNVGIFGVNGKRVRTGASDDERARFELNTTISAEIHAVAAFPGAHGVEILFILNIMERIMVRKTAKNTPARKVGETIGEHNIQNMIHFQYYGYGKKNGEKHAGEKKGDKP